VIRQRYLRFNGHAMSYTWKRLGTPLDMTKTLQDNGVEDDAAELRSLGLAGNSYLPTIHLYFNDDLTVA